MKSNTQGVPMLAAARLSDEPIALPFRRALDMIGLGVTKGCELTRPGPNGEPPEIASFTIGRYRYILRSELDRFIQQRVQQSQQEAAGRAGKVQRAVAERARRRSEESAAV